MPVLGVSSGSGASGWATADEEGTQRRQAPPVSFLTTEPNGVVEPLQDKAMPVLIRTKEEAEQWLEAPPEAALQLQKPAPDEAIEVPKEKKS